MEIGRYKGSNSVPSEGKRSYGRGLQPGKLDESCAGQSPQTGFHLNVNGMN